uniref:ribonuclease H n=1 Tax=viral metagenome TaxID=1070528 RepID=A0A6C0F5Q8_9ZZZZ
MTIKVFTDGSCIYCNDKTKTSSGGWAIHIPDFQHESSEPICPGVSSTYVELFAINKALDYIIKNKIINNQEKEFMIYTDCLPCLNKIMSNELYIKSKNKDILNKLLNDIRNKVSKVKVKFTHVTAHTNKQNELSLGNRRVDELAKKAAKDAKCVNNEIYLLENEIPTKKERTEKEKTKIKRERLQKVGILMPVFQNYNLLSANEFKKKLDEEGKIRNYAKNQIEDFNESDSSLTRIEVNKLVRELNQERMDRIKSTKHAKSAEIYIKERKEKEKTKYKRERLQKVGILMPVFKNYDVLSANEFKKKLDEEGKIRNYAKNQIEDFNESDSSLTRIEVNKLVRELNQERMERMKISKHAKSAEIYIKEQKEKGKKVAQEKKKKAALVKLEEKEKTKILKEQTGKEKTKYKRERLQKVGILMPVFKNYDVLSANEFVKQLCREGIIRKNAKKQIEDFNESNSSLTRCEVNKLVRELNQERMDRIKARRAKIKQCEFKTPKRELINKVTEQKEKISKLEKKLNQTRNSIRKALNE